MSDEQIHKHDMFFPEPDNPPRERFPFLPTEV
jgi:hypothetical protein